MRTKPEGNRNTRAMLTEASVNGIRKILPHIQLPVQAVNDPEIQSAIRFLTRTIELFDSPEAKAKREKVRTNKTEWVKKKKEEQ